MRSEQDARIQIQVSGWADRDIVLIELHGIERQGLCFNDYGSHHLSAPGAAEGAVHDLAHDAVAVMLGGLELFG